MKSYLVRDAHQGMLQYKGQMMGVSIILIFLCHMGIGSWPILMVFAPCVIGCDIFMILSGASQGYSYQKNSLGKFYWRRITRIYPMYLVLTLATCAIKQMTEGGVTAMDVMKGVTFLSYYGWGG